MNDNEMCMTLLIADDDGNAIEIKDIVEWERWWKEDGVKGLLLTTFLDIDRKELSATDHTLDEIQELAHYYVTSSIVPAVMGVKTGESDPFFLPYMVTSFYIHSDTNISGLHYSKENAMQQHMAIVHKIKSNFVMGGLEALVSRISKRMDEEGGMDSFKLKKGES